VKQVNSLDQVWTLVDQGVDVYWSSKSYKVYVEVDVMPDRTLIHAGRSFASRDGRILSVRCIDNYFGSIISPSDLSKLFTE
jgi:hypothetical protein